MEIRYVKYRDLHVAYTVWGNGPPDVMFISNGITDIESMFDVPVLRDFFVATASFARSIGFDQIGSGHSDRVPLETLTLEDLVATIGVVMDVVGVERAALVAWDMATPIAIAFAAAHPDRVSAMVLIGASARYTGDDGYPGPTKAALDLGLDQLADAWATPAYGALLAPSMAHDTAQLEGIARWQRQAATPGLARRLFEVGTSFDVRQLLPSVDCPVLVVGSNSTLSASVSQMRHVADRVPDGRLVLYESNDHIPYRPEHRVWFNDTIEEFLTGRRPKHDVSERVLTTVLFTDVVESTDTLARVGDRAWRRRLDALQQATTDELQRHRGTLVKSMGDGVVATFDAPTRGILCADALHACAARQGVQMRAGLHELKGVPDEWRLFAVVST